MNKFAVIIAITVLFACNNSENDKKEKISVDSQLIGEWNNIYLKVDINSKNNSDSTDVLEVDRPQWEEKLKIKPIRSFFRADSTWNSAHYNLKDSLAYNPSGKWWVNENKLTMLQLKPSVDTTVYTIGIKSDTATFEAMIDWDGDGKRDDRYYGRQVKVKQ